MCMSVINIPGCQVFGGKVKWQVFKKHSMPLFGEKKKSGKKGPAKDSAQGKVHLLLVEPCEHKEEEVPFGLITRKGEGDGKPQGLLTACAHLELSRYIIVRDAFFRILDSPSGAFEYCIHVHWFKSRKYGDDCWIKIPLPGWPFELTFVSILI